MSLIKEFEAIKTAIRNGEKTAEEVKDFALRLLQKHDELVKEVEATYTVAQLKKKVPHAYSNAKKAELASSHASEIVEWFAYLTSNSFSFTLEGSYRTSWEKALRGCISNITDEALQKYAQNILLNLEEEKKKLEGIVNPVTLLDFKRRISTMGESSLTAEMLPVYDRLMYEATAGLTKEVTEVAPVDLGETSLAVKASWHTKRNIPIWLVQLSERVEREKFTELAEKAKQWGAKWNSYPPNDPSNHGFLFFSESDANAFASLTGSTADNSERLARLEQERQERVRDRLLSYAHNKVSSSQQILNQQRLTNTYRRATMAAHTEASAREEIAFANTVAGVADAIESGAAGELAKISFASHIQTLCYVLNNSWRDAVRAENEGRYTHPDKWRPMEMKDVNCAKYPWPRLRPGMVKDLIATLNKKGTRGIGYPLQVMTALFKGDDWIELNTNAKLEAFQTLLDKAPLSRWEQRQVDEQMAHWKRLKAMGINNLPALRHLLRQLLPYYQTAGKPDPLVVAERALIGVNIPGFFPTPMPIVNRMIELADMDNFTPYKVLEPSAGKGNIVDGLMAYGLADGATIECVEVNSSLQNILRMKGYCVWDENFMTFTRSGYDRVLMNPPFEKGADFAHLKRALELLNPDGVVVCIVANGATYQKEKEWLYSEVTLIHDEELPAGTFKESGTNVTSRLLVVRR